MGLKFYNTLTRRRDEFVPLHPPRVNMYVCGPTVYGHSHLGHAKSYTSFDVIVRWMRASGYQVYYVQNITDVGHLTDDADEGEDKIVVFARQRGLHPMAVVDTFVQSYLEDMDALNILRPDIMPRATGHIPEQVAMIEQLIAGGHAYVVNGSVYFSVATFKDYGKLSGRKLEELEAGARVEVNSEKRDPADFALWKRAEESHIMRWPSPWGDGFPGWHIECSAMSRKYLGDTLDIHGGGLENQFPHHECEIAQSEAATGKQFVRFWLHNNMVTLNGQKMGKSLGNAISLKDVFQGREGGVRDKKGELLLEKTYEPAVVRHFLLTTHYRQTIDFSNEALHGAESGSYKLRDALRELVKAADSAPSAPRRDAVAAALAEFESRATESMNEDINTAATIAGLFDLARQSGEWIRGGVGKEDLTAALAMFRKWATDILGFSWRDEPRGDNGKADAVIGILAELRLQARKDKNFALGDEIRKRLSAIGVELRDTPQGTTW